MDSILFKAVLLNKIVNLKTPLIMSLRKIKRIINYCVLIIGFAVCVGHVILKLNMF